MSGKPEKTTKVTNNTLMIIILVIISVFFIITIILLSIIASDVSENYYKVTDKLLKNDEDFILTPKKDLI